MSKRKEAVSDRDSGVDSEARYSCADLVEATPIVSSGVVKELAYVRPWIPCGTTSHMVKLKTGTDQTVSFPPK